MKEEHKQALMEGRSLYAPNTTIQWDGEFGYVNMTGPIKNKKRNLSWEDVEAYYEWFEENQWWDRDKIE